ncbi:MAG: DUF899 family protein [Chthoniobacterales bacterium]
MRRDNVFHTYSSFGRGGELAIGTYHFFDLVPKGCDEDGLPFPMAWVALMIGPTRIQSPRERFDRLEGRTCSC